MSYHANSSTSKRKLNIPKPVPDMPNRNRKPEPKIIEEIILLSDDSDGETPLVPAPKKSRIEHEVMNDEISILNADNNDESVSICNGSALGNDPGNDEAEAVIADSPMVNGNGEIDNNLETNDELAEPIIQNKKDEVSTQPEPDDQKPTCSKYLDKKSKKVKTTKIGSTSRSSGVVKDEDNDENYSADDEDCTITITIKDLESAIKDFIDLLRTLIKEPKEFEAAEFKIKEPLKEIEKRKNKSFNYGEIYQRVVDLTHEMEKKGKPFKNTAALISSLKLVKNNKPVDNSVRIAEKTLELENYLRLLETKIEELDQCSDYDEKDDLNSPFMIVDRLKRRYMRTVRMLYKLQNPKKVSSTNVLTDRPVQKVIKIQGITHYPEFDEAVEKAVNQRSALWKNALSYGDIHHIIQKVKNQKKIIISDQDLKQSAIELLTYITRKMKQRRRMDLQIALKVEEGLKDPADDDVELRNKLEANRKLAKSESEVIRQFAEKQQETQPLAANDNESEGSETESMPEEDDDDFSDSDVEECDEDGKVIKRDKAVKKQQQKALQAQVKTERTEAVENDYD